MKKILITFLLCSTLVANDKLLHLSVSYGGHLTLSKLFTKKIDKIIYPSLIMFSAGIVKELIDDRIDNEDVLYNTIGIGLSNVVVITFD